MSSAPATSAIEPRHAGRVDLWQHGVEWAITAINVIALFTGLMICAGLDGTAQAWAGIFLALFGPGTGLIQLVGPFDTTVRAALVVGLSLATCTLLAQVLLSVGSIGVLQAAIPLTLITSLGLLARLIRYVNRPEAETTIERPTR